ncbi:uncharacterized protein A4U43_C07F30500 [Asparagus officinalis]|uniref:Embryo defective 1273 n=1 Tax=Asparagus officinalis TaxID=4686 RepID=A0A5P1EI31_ASPOF|nr:uncharacterized protein LOC109848636 [Asparagus officinalis]XP_020273838.1 uncharacterized protein LOC109848636 [Asparagus officinalis]XP_020273839.1 uncharacterized protein LOC109848636 [Asparagus officinalis]XP_020273840.1 uncharacterized protein LOC109848636 [Asparagus officinalis]XP_020273841.1 uncharacterized protein LOC109848636 [Asparagus officinalis]ONK64837.1 uncharacterized protein A4U43_C07F30500 [Asparagus officinalis]
MSSLLPSLTLSPPHRLHSLSYNSPSSLTQSPPTSLYRPPTPQFPPKPKTLTLTRSPNPKTRLVPLAINVTAGNPEDPSRKLDISGVADHARELFDNLPQPVKSFPWSETLWKLMGIVLDLAVEVGKYLSLPVLALSQLSEMSYCAHERKLVLVPIPFLVGFAVAGVMKDTAAGVSSDLKEGGFPWHLLLIALFFVLLKLPGPYYPYWGRLLIPHFANGGLWRSIWLAFIWYKRTQSLPLGDDKY